MMPPRSSRYIPALDGVRGIAVLMVTIWHYSPFPLSNFFPGWTGVDLFFVLSGYLITGRLLDLKGQKDFFSRFYRNRALRIFPLYYALVIPFLIAISFVQEKHLPTLLLYKQHWLSFILFTQNWSFIRFGMPSDASLQHLWSLAIEEQFYLVWPLVILLIPSARLRLKIFSLLILLILLTRCAFHFFDPASAKDLYYNTFFRMDSLIAGSLLLQLHRSGLNLDSRWVARIALTLLSCVILFVAGMNGHPFNAFFTTAGFTILAMLFACFIHLALQPGKPLNRFCTTPFLRFFGKISFGLYIFHVPVLTVIGNRLLYTASHRWPDHTGMISWIVPILCFLLSLLLSVISRRYYECFFLRLKAEDLPSANKQ